MPLSFCQDLHRRRRERETASLSLVRLRDHEHDVGHLEQCSQTWNREVGRTHERSARLARGSRIHELFSERGAWSALFEPYSAAAPLEARFCIARCTMRRLSGLR